MTNRIKQKFDDLKKQGRAGLVTFTMAFDPDRNTSEEVLRKLPEAGADIIELGMPFSDPMADGPAIQKAGIRALAAGAKLRDIIDMVRSFRKYDNTTPVILMGYYNPIHNYGIDQFTNEAHNAGVDGLIIVDLPIEEDDELYNSAKKQHIDLIRLVTPTTNDDRLQRIIKKAGGFIYYVSVAGVTGTKSAAIESIGKAVDNIKKYTNVPVAVGFGIKDAESAAEVGKVADAVVVGSELINNLTISSERAISFLHSISNKLKKL